MKKFAKGIAVASIATMGLAACSAASLSDLLSSATGQSFLSALSSTGTLIPGLQSVITDLDNGITSGGGTAALSTLCYALPWADSAVDYFGKTAGVPVDTITQIDSSVAAFKAGPCTTPPTNIAQVITQGVSLFITIENNLKSSGVPVAVPVSTSYVKPF